MIFSVFNSLKLVYGLEVEVLYIMFYVDDYKCLIIIYYICYYDNT
jgi:hypothetical protein